jgi:hypothetical protein
MVCSLLSKITGIPWGSEECIASREMGQNGVDVRLIGPALKIVGLSIECKAQESWNVHAWVEQAKANTLKGTHWAVIAKQSRKDPIIFMDMYAFFDLFRIIIDRRQEDPNKSIGTPSRLTRRK